MCTYEVNVSKVGTVYSGDSRVDATKDFRLYRVLSKRGQGRAAGEDVVLTLGEVIVKEYTAPDKEEG